MKRFHVARSPLLFMLPLLLTTIALLNTKCTQPVEEATLFRLTEAQAILLSDAWTGLSPLAPLRARHTLQRSPDAFNGQAHFSIAGYSDNPREAEVDIAIPLGVVERFLEMLEQAPMRPGIYEPSITHTDDYPSLRIEIVLEADTVAIFSESQGDHHIPWGATIRGQSYVINTDTPSKAIEVLAPYLKRDVMGSLVDEGRQ